MENLVSNKTKELNMALCLKLTVNLSSSPITPGFAKGSQNPQTKYELSAKDTGKAT